MRRLLKRDLYLSRSVRCLVLLLAAVMFPCSLLAATYTVAVGDRSYTPSVVTIHLGDTVNWVRNPSRYDGSLHSVSGDDGDWGTILASRINYSHAFNSPGEFGYHCNGKVAWNHHHRPGLVVVEDAGGGAADLVLQKVEVPTGPYRVGDAIPIDLTIENAGGQASGAYSVTYYASRYNSIIDASATELGTDNLPSLNAGESTNLAGNPVFPAGIAFGNYFIGAIINVSDAHSVNNMLYANSTVQAEVQINAGLNGAWFNSSTPRQGFFISVFPDTSPDRPQPVMLVGWFTYDLERPPADVTAMIGEPGHRWLTAYGPYSGDTAQLDIELTQGGTFDSGSPVPQQTPGYGTMTVRFSNCTTGVLYYDIPSAGVSGAVPIERVTNDNVALCESLQTR